MWSARALKNKAGIVEARSSRRLQDSADTQCGSWETEEAAHLGVLSPKLNERALTTSSPSSEVQVHPPADKSAPSAKSTRPFFSSSPRDTSVDGHLIFKTKGCRLLAKSWKDEPRVLTKSLTRMLLKSRTGLEQFLQLELACPASPC